MSTAAGVDIWEGGNMKEQHIRERCQYLIDSIYGPQADGNMGASYDEYVQEAESLCWEMIGEGLERAAAHFDASDSDNAWAYANWCRQEAQRMKEGGK